jgi:hypothetical protein
MSEQVLSGLRTAAALLRDGAAPADAARALGAVPDDGDPSDRLILVTPPDPPWSLVQVQASADGALAGLLLDLPAGAAVPLAALVPVLGEAGGVDRAPDAATGHVLYDPPELGCRVRAELEAGPAPAAGPRADRFALIPH